MKVLSLFQTCALGLGIGLAAPLIAELDWLNKFTLRRPLSGAVEFSGAQPKGEDTLLIGSNNTVALLKGDEELKVVFWETPTDAVRGLGIYEDSWAIYTDQLHLSEDGVNWTSYPQSPSDPDFFGTVRLQDQDYLLALKGTELYLSIDAQNWQTISEPFSEGIDAMASALNTEFNLNGLFYERSFQDLALEGGTALIQYSFFFPGNGGAVVQRDLVFESDDLVNWTVASDEFADAFETPLPEGFHFDTAKIGETTYLFGVNGSVFFRTELGTDWNQLFTVFQQDSLSLGAMWSRGDALFATSTDGKIYRSQTTLPEAGWNVHTSYVEEVPGNFRWVAFGNSKFVTPNTNGRIYVSLAGDQWSSYVPNIEFDPSDEIRFLDGFFLIGDVDSSEIRSYSADGFTWTRVSDDPLSFTRAGGKFIRTVEKGAFPNKAIENSADGIEWTERLAAGLRTVYSDGEYAYVETVETEDTPSKVIFSEDGGDSWSDFDSASVPKIARDPPRFPEIEGKQIEVERSNSYGTSQDFPTTIVYDGQDKAQIYQSGGFVAGAYGRGTLVLVGGHHTIYQSDRDPSLSPSNMVNLSTRGFNDEGERSLIVGFYTVGSSDDYLIRGIGPTLAEFDVTGTISDPVLNLARSTTVLAENDDWGDSPNAAEMPAVFSATGAFSLPEGSVDSAMLRPFSQGAYSAVLSAPEAGEAMVELYSTNRVSSGLRNLSSRGFIEAGGTMVGGFVVTGEKPLSLLIRGIGPGLSNFEITEFLPDPTLKIFSGENLLLKSDTAIDQDRLDELSLSVGAFALTEGDAAMEFTAPPGIYTIHLTTTANNSGVCLLELYLAK